MRNAIFPFMKAPFTLIAALAAPFAFAQTQVTTSSFKYNDGVHPTFSVTIPGTDADKAEKWFKDQLKAISASTGGKNEVVGIGTRLPEVSGDTIRVFVKADQPKKSPDVTVHAAFRVNMAFVGADGDEAQREACRKWVYQTTVDLKKHMAQLDLDAANKMLTTLESDLAGLVKEKGRAEDNLEKTQHGIVDDQKSKVEAEGEAKILETKVESKKQEVVTSPTEENTKDLQSLMKDQEKLRKKAGKLTEDIAAGKRKVEDLEFQIKKNLSEQNTKTKAIATQKEAVALLTAKLAGIN